MTFPELHQIRDRHQMIRFFDGYASERMEEVDDRKLKKPLVKSHLLEFLDRDHAGHTGNLMRPFERHAINLRPLEEGLFLVADEQIGDVGFLEILTHRILALYSPRKREELDPWIRRLVSETNEIDHVWLSGHTFTVLWKLVVRLSKPNRFSRLVFTHESIFDIDSCPEWSKEDDEGETPDTDQDADVEEIVERRATKFHLVDRVGVIDQKLSQLQNLYSPLYAISQLRFPSPVGRGGHDFYDNGKVTNRSESFRDHRAHLLFVVRIYEQLLESTEKITWYSVRESVGLPGQFRKVVGAPVIIRFREPLSPQTFDSFVQSTFQRKRNKFRLWGHPIRLGATKVHVYGVDRHLWQPLFLELTDRGCVAVIPNGTCGNTVHRLVTNVQRYLDPGAEASIGDRAYQQVVEASAQGVQYEPGRY